MKVSVCFVNIDITLPKMADFDYSKLIDFLELVGRLKHVKRTGWVIRNVDDCETISGHMYRMGMMTFLLNGTTNNLDRLKCLELALVHDLAECIVGDLTPFCGVSPEEKHRREDEAMKDIANLTGPSGILLYDLYKEYEAKATPEAIFVKELDRFDLALQAFEYEKRENSPHSLQEIFLAANKNFSHPLIVGLLGELLKRRTNFENKDIRETAADEKNST